MPFGLYSSLHSVPAPVHAAGRFTLLRRRSAVAYTSAVTPFAVADKEGLFIPALPPLSLCLWLGPHLAPNFLRHFNRAFPPPPPSFGFGLASPAVVWRCLPVSGPPLRCGPETGLSFISPALVPALLRL